MKIGVIVARFQVPVLHKGHIKLIRHVLDDSDKVLIYLGNKVAQLDKKNPYHLKVRKGMLENTLKGMNELHRVYIDTIEDHPESNELWSKDLDNKIDNYINTHNINEYEVNLYGSRDSFIKAYEGKNKTVIIEDERDEEGSFSGTKMRENVLKLSPLDLSVSHREGILYGLSYLYPVGMSVVDVLVYKVINDEMLILLGRKPRESKFRILGGFFDVSIDDSLEAAALRELGEEVTNLEVGTPTYVMSKKIDDWRYRDNQHKIVSSLFILESFGGECIPSDDIEEAKWFKIDEIDYININDSHIEFIKAGINKIKML